MSPESFAEGMAKYGGWYLFAVAVSLAGLVIAYQWFERKAFAKQKDDEAIAHENVFAKERASWAIERLALNERIALEMNRHLETLRQGPSVFELSRIADLILAKILQQKATQGTGTPDSDDGSKTG